MAKQARPPVIAVMGHIDHGKSSLLDYIRKENVVSGEAGGITQHVAAYIAEHAGRPITFLDTPGHEAFKALRTRGAAAADIAILVVAADEGVMPQTMDAYAAIQEAAIPFVVAVTKIDKNNADIEHAKHSLLEKGIYLEGLGGDISFAAVSSKTGEGIPELLDVVLLTADLAELTADRALEATGFVLESTQDPKRGASATLIVKDGTLAKGSFVVAGNSYAPVRFIEDFNGKRVESVGPSEPAQVSGFTKLPSAGTIFVLAKNKKEADALASAQTGTTITARTQTVEGVTELPLIIKADVAGSIDAIQHEIAKLTTDRVSVQVVSSGVGTVSEGDVKTANASGAHIIAFNTATDNIARDLAERDDVHIDSFTIIYELSERIMQLITERTPEVSVEQEVGRATVLKTFSSSAKKQVLGAKLTSGMFSVGGRVQIVRAGEVLARGTVSNLQQARADVKELRALGEFGTEIEARENARPGDELVQFVDAVL